ncbi:hypothetical protein FZI02_08905 [Cronobacter sakazakii]|nr:hypothetical protein [Cronobacter sakazakii]EJG0747461.1 hypothetical protein [Cronobacter sakazakii]KAB0839057.1 hypothetical protein FZI45_19005 [Cronobacter sakazakii]KAB0840118.1 hypothetical protein FZI02_08905 [Cronobacter sakazakii]
MDKLTLLLLSFILGSISTLLTSRVALGKFYKEKWWEKRALAFNELISSIYKLKVAYINIMDEHYNFTDGNSSNESEWEEITLIRRELIRLCDLGPLILTQYATTIIKKYFDSLDRIHKENNKMDALTTCEIYYQLTDDLLSEMISHARDELKILTIMEKIKISIQNFWRNKT